MQHEIFNDDEFRQQPYDVQKKVATNYFNEELADDEFFKLEPDVQDKIRTNFMKEVNVFDQQVELDNMKSLESQFTIPEDVSATAIPESPFPEKKQDVIKLDKTGIFDGATENTYRGNIDLNARKLNFDNEGNYKTEESITIKDQDNNWVVIPTIIDGQKVDNRTAEDYFYKTGEHLGKYTNFGDSERAAQLIHERQADHYKEAAVQQKAINAFGDKIAAADQTLNVGSEWYGKMSAEDRVKGAFEFFKENIADDTFNAMTDTERKAVLTSYLEQVVKPKENELQYQHNMWNMTLKNADKILYTLTGNKDYNTLADTRDYMQSKDKTTLGAIGGFAGEVAPYVGIGIATAPIRGLGASLLTDSGLSASMSFLENARSDEALGKIAADVALDTVANGLTYGVFRILARGNIAKGDYDAAAQKLFGKNADQLDPEELASFKKIEEQAKLKLAEETAKLPDDQKARIEEAANYFDNMAKESEGKVVGEIDGKNIVETPTAKAEATGTGAGTQEFFGDVANGNDAKFKPSKPYEYETQFSDPLAIRVKDSMDSMKGQFDEHIATSIPTFRDTQVEKGKAIISTYPDGASMIDLGGSEGGFVKTITKESNGKIKTVNLDASSVMATKHNGTPVDGSAFEHGAFQQGWEAGDTREAVPTFTPKEKYDVVHESMMFQFIEDGGERASKLDEIKSKYLKDDGLLITEEKFKLNDPEIYKTNEKLKANHKDKYYTKEQQSSKSEHVLVGMEENQASFDNYLDELHNRFEYVGTYWTSGNFRGVVASNNKDKFTKFMNNFNEPAAAKTYTHKKVYGTEDIVEGATAADYAVAMRKARSALGDKADLVTPVSEVEAQKIIDDGGTLFTTKDGKAGAYVTADGYMGGLFRNPTSDGKAAANILQEARIKHGGKIFDSFANNEELYIRNGWKPVARMKFNPDYAPAGWETNSALKGRPDNVFFTYDPKGEIKAGNGAYFDDWDQAYTYALNYGKNGSNAKEIAAAERVLAFGSKDLGGALGGLTLNEAAMYYDENLLGRELTKQEKWARRILAAAGGAYAGRKFGGVNKSTNMFVGAKADEVGAFSNIHDKKVRKWIDDSAAEVGSRHRTPEMMLEKIEDVKIRKILKSWLDGKIKKVETLDPKIDDYWDQVEGKFRAAIDSGDDVSLKKYREETDAIRYIRDKNFVMDRFEKNTPFSVETVLKHDELYTQYPELKKFGGVNVTFKNMKNGVQGSFDGRRNIEISSDFINDPEKIKSIILHELQHKIQATEGWARGGSPEEFKTMSSKVYLGRRNILIESLNEWTDVKEWNLFKQGKIKFEDIEYPLRKELDTGTPVKRSEYVTEMLKNEIDLGNFANYKKEPAKAVANAENKIKEYRERLDDFMKNHPKPETDFSQYERLAGEQEARATQAALEHPELEPYQALKKKEGVLKEPIVKMDEAAAMSAKEEPREKNFKKWFGDSVVKSSDGKPVVMYHGSTGNIEAFDKSKIRLNDYDVPYNGFWFTNQASDASPAMVNPSNTTPVYLSIKNPATRQQAVAVSEEARDMIQAAIKADKLDEFHSEMAQYGIREHSLGDLTRHLLQQKGYDGVHHLQPLNITKADFDEAIAKEGKYWVNKREYLKPDEYGGIDLYHKNDGHITGYDDLEDFLSQNKESIFVAFEPEQIKSINNSGSFSKADPNLLQSNPLEALRFMVEEPVLGIMNGFDWTVRKVQKMLLKGKTVDEALGDLLKAESDNAIIDKIKKAVVQDYRLSDQYLALADQAQIAIKKGEAEAHKIFEMMKDIPEDDLTKIHDFVGGESNVIPAHLQTLAEAAKRAIKAKTHELVSLGLLPDDILRAYNDGYVHREYAKHIKKAIADMFFSNQKKLAAGYKRGKIENVSAEKYAELQAAGEVGDNIRQFKYVFEGKTPSGKIKLRRDWTKAEREQMGEVTNAAFTIPNTIVKLQRDIAYGNFLAQVATDPALRDTIMTADDMAAHLGLSAVKDIPDSGTGFIKLSGRQFGKLDGMYVEEAVANDIKGFKNSLFGDDREVFEAWKTFLTEWKVAKTVKNPTAHMNNFLSNMVMSYYAGIKPSDVGKNMIASMNEIRTKGRYFREAEEVGLFGRSKLEDIRRLVDIPTQKVRGAASKVARNIYMSEDSALGSKAYALYSLEDDIARLSLYMHYRKKGLSQAQAMKESGKVVFDYTKRMPPLLRGLRDTGLVPFVSWTYKSLPLMFSTMFQRPSRYAAAVGAYVLIDEALNGKNEKPEFMRGKYITINRSGKESQQLRIASMTPYFDWITEPTEALKQQMVGGLPLKPVEFATGRQFWNDQKITYRDGKGAVLDYGLWTANNLLPTPAYIQKVYNVGEAVANDGRQHKRNKLFKPRSTAEAAAGLFGFNVRTYDQAEQRSRDREKQRRELKKK